MEKVQSRWALGLGLLALVLYLLLPMERLFSDGQFLIELVKRGPAPYYNVAYVPLGYALHALFSPLAGASIESTLTAFSALLMAAGTWGTVRLGARLGLSTPAVVFAGLLVACSPGALFFGGVVEVHPMQFAGAVWAFSIAWSAGEKQGAAAWRFLALAFAVAFLAHLSHALLLPGLWLVARRSGTPSGCRIARRGWPWIAAAIVLGVCGIAYLSTFEFSGLSRRGDLVWISALWVFAKNFVDASLERGFYSFIEMGEYLTDELVLQAGVLLLGLLVGAYAWTRHFARRKFDDKAGEFAARAFPAILPAVFVFAQGGIFEHGAYFLSYYPVLALALAWSFDRLRGARAAWLGFAGVLVAAQLTLGLIERTAYQDGRIDARAWLASIDSQLGMGDSIVTSTLAREYALEVGRPDLAVVDLKRRMDSVPARGRSALLTEEMGIAMARLAGPNGADRSMWIDKDLFERRWLGASDDWRDELAELLHFPGVRVDEVRVPGADLLRVRLRQ